MKGFLKKYFFLLMGVFLIISNKFMGITNAAITPAYGPPRNLRDPVEPISIWMRYFSNFLLFVYFLIVPIIFFIGLYFYLTRKKDKKRKDKGLKFMKLAFIIIIITFLLGTLVEMLVKLYFS